MKREMQTFPGAFRPSASFLLEAASNMCYNKQNIPQEAAYEFSLFS